jgi:ABC-type transport system involved in multi-copper enzyme maturation permease subunit
MIRNFIAKEIVENISGPKFLITFVICAALILTSVYTGYMLYRSELSSRETAIAAGKAAMENAGSYGTLRDSGSKAIRPPDRLSIFAKGVDSAIGRAATVGSDLRIDLRDSRYGLNPIFAVFGELDLDFIVRIILALFAILFSYNAVSGERELGTLKQVHANSVSRASFIIGKTIGGLLTLLIPFLVPLLIALLMLMLLFGVSFTGEEWARLGLMILGYCIYLMLFYMVGMAMSSLTRSSAISFLLCLFIWVLSIAVVPKAAVEAASFISPAPSIDEVEKDWASLQRRYWATFKTRVEGAINKVLRENPQPARGDIRSAEDAARKEVDAEFESERLAYLQRYELEQERLLNTALGLTRLSPTSCLQFAASRLAHTDVNMRERFLESLRRFRQELLKYADKKIKEAGRDQGERGVAIMVTPMGAQVKVPELQLDLGDAPVFEPETEPLATSAAAALPDLGILACEFLLLFAVAFVAFLRYDVR